MPAIPVTALLVAAVAILSVMAVGIVISRLYRRATPEASFVRTGFGGLKVVQTGGALIFPILHEAMTVNMKTMRLEIERKGKESLTTKDRLRVDVQVAFFTRVKPDEEAISRAAQTLGEKTLNPEEIKELVEPKFANALRQVSVEMTISELLDRRQDFVQRVQTAVAEDLDKNGLMLEAASLTSMEQTKKEFFDANNVFDAEGLAKIVAETQKRQKEINDIQQSTAVAIANRNYEAQKQQLTIAQSQQEATLNQQREIAVMTANQGAEIAKTQADRQREAQEAQIVAEQAVEQAKIRKNQLVQISAQESDIALAKKSEERSAADARANDARAEAVKAEQAVVTAEQVAKAERDKSIAVIASRQDAERDAVRITVAAEAQRKAATDKAQAAELEATGQANADKIRAAGIKAKLTAEAEGQRAVNEAANALSDAQVTLRRALATIEALPRILAETVKPLEKINSIKIVQVGGMMPGGGATNGAGDGSNATNLSDQVVNSALRFRAQQPLVDSLLSELGLKGGDISTLSSALGANGTNGASFPVNVSMPVHVSEGQPAVTVKPAPKAGR